MMFSVASVVSGAEEFTIQTISAFKESSLTPAFKQKVHNIALPSATFKEGKCNIVTVGNYESSKAAHNSLAKGKKVAHDAFVRPKHRVIPELCQPQVAIAAPAEIHPAVAAVAVNKPAETPLAEVAEAKVSTVAQTVAPSVAEHENVAVNKADCIPLTGCEKRAARNKAVIEEALKYYSSSSYYRFSPTALPQ